jgi:hypothetical protein
MKNEGSRAQKGAKQVKKRCESGVKAGAAEKYSLEFNALPGQSPNVFLFENLAQALRPLRVFPIRWPARSPKNGLCKRFSGTEFFQRQGAADVP